MSANDRGDAGSWRSVSTRPNTMEPWNHGRVEERVECGTHARHQHVTQMFGDMFNNRIEHAGNVGHLGCFAGLFRQVIKRVVRLRDAAEENCDNARQAAGFPNQEGGVR